MKRDPDVRCDACDYNAPVRPYERGGGDAGPPMMLCRICAATPAGLAFQYAHRGEERGPTWTTAHAANAILDAMGKLWPGAEQPEGSSPSDAEIGMLEAEIARLKHENKSLDAQVEEAVAARDEARELIEKEREAWGSDLRYCRERIVKLEAKLAIHNVSIPEETEDGLEGTEYG